MNQQQAAAQSTSNTAQGQKKFFDLHTRGLGYLNRVRMVTTKGKGGRRGDSFLACAVNALHGDSEDPNPSLTTFPRFSLILVWSHPARPHGC